VSIGTALTAWIYDSRLETGGRVAGRVMVISKVLSSGGF
jgi:hypothetical protein